MEGQHPPSSPRTPGKPFSGRGGVGSVGSSREASRAPSRTPSRPSSPLASAASSTHMDGGERPAARRTTSKFQAFRRARPRYNRAKSSTAPPVPESGVPLTAIARLARRTNNNLRMWRLRYSNGSSSRRTELDRLRELDRSELLFAEQFTVLPSLLVAASALQSGDGGEKKVPVLLQQLGVRVTEESAKHYRNMVRIHLEYGGGFSLIAWEIVRGYRDLLVLRAKLKADLQGGRVRKVKVPKLPHPRTYGVKADKVRHGVFGRHADHDDEEFDDFNDEDLDQSSDSDDDAPAAPAPEAYAAGAGGAGAELNVEAQQSHSLARDATRTPTSYAQAVEIWLQKVQLMYLLRPDSNSLMHFFELSHLSMKLASEYTYHGKEGSLVVRSRASELGWHVSHLQPRDFKDMVERHTPKWVLVRDSYIVIVDNINSTRIREVFLVDPYFKLKHIEEDKEAMSNNLDAHSDAHSIAVALADIDPAHKKSASAKSVFLHISNNARELKLAAATERELRQWQVSMLQMKHRTPWARPNRFDSFAPVRKNVFGQWFVDGRDYMWVLSEALENARDTIFILDWWLSPELYLRRPPEGNQKWRLDRVLKRKAEQGVKIFVVVYRNVGPTIPIDSTWTKYSLLDLHENVHIIRSPNQLSNKASLFWAHHEKLCVVDSTVAFNGGVDLCYGRWDTWQHVLTDDAPTPFLPKDPTTDEWKQRTQLFPGKDYSNARVKDFFELNKPYDDMYDRNHVPRMPWHDIHQMVVGQPARDLARHFVQRWNYVVRNKIPSRWTPLLLPPPDFTKEDLERLQLTGTCEYQVLRSSGDWSLGLRHHEQSIQNAYLKLIEESEHLVYIENQFFITSTEVDGVLIENQIGNALVQRIVRAHERNEPWKAFILIPLMPGFEAEVDTDKASSVRVICQCQFNSISRGPNSIFYRLESLGIRPDRYIHFFSLRKWGKFSNTLDAPNEGRICTELLYIHAKCMVVDDRIAIIGSANINERSMRGLRDSELAVCVRDTKVVESKMAGKPWKAAKFAHTLRVRLMREHLGVDIDKMETIERLTSSLEQRARQARRAQAQQYRRASETSEPTLHEEGANAPLEGDEQFPTWLYPELHSFNWYAGTSVNRGIRDHKKLSRDSRIQGNAEHKADVEGDGPDHWVDRDHQAQSQDTRYHAEAPDVEMENEARAIMKKLLEDRSIKSRDQFMRRFYALLTGQDILRVVKRSGDLPLPHTDEEGLRAVNNENIPIDPWKFQDPLDEQFVNDKWLAAAERNTLIYRLVFRCQPDDEVETWKDYKTFSAHLERFYAKQREDGGPDKLRESGHHEPERVDKHVLDGTLKKTNPEFLKWSALKPPPLPNMVPNLPWQNATNNVTAETAAAHSETPAPVNKATTTGSGAGSSNAQSGNIPGIAVNEALADYHGAEPTSEQDPDSHHHHHHHLHLHHEHHHDHANGHDGKHRTAETGAEEARGLPDGGVSFNPEYSTSPKPDGSSNKLSDSTARRVPNGVSNSQPNGAPNGVPNGVPNGAPNGVPSKSAYGADNKAPAPTDESEGYFDAAVPSRDPSPGGEADGKRRRVREQISEELHERLHRPHHHSINNFVNSMGVPAEKLELLGLDIKPGGREPPLDSGSEFEQEQSDVVGSEPFIRSEPSRLQPTQSSASSRRRAMTMSAATANKPSRRWGHFDHVLDAQVAEDMLQGVTGHLVVFPTEWLNRELDSGNWNFQLDRIAPLEIYD